MLSCVTRRICLLVLVACGQCGLFACLCASLRKPGTRRIVHATFAPDRLLPVVPLKYLAPRLFAAYTLLSWPLALDAAAWMRAQEALLLLASANPRESPSAHLLEPSRRATVVKLVHAALMHSIGKEKHSELERMVAHLDVVQSEMAAESILVGRLVSLRAAIREGLPAAIALEPSPASHDTGMDIG